MEQASIFIVEDDALVVSHLQQILSDFQYNVAGIAASGQEALDLIPKTNPDLILMDIRLRGNMNGLETAQRISQKMSIPIIFLTAHANFRYLSEAKMDSVFSYLLKPIRSIDLHSNIQMALYKYQLQNQLKLTNAILNMRQKLNRMMLEPGDQKTFLNAVCKLLYDSGVFATTFIILFSDARPTDVAFSPDVQKHKNKLFAYLKKGQYPTCVKTALEKRSVVYVDNQFNECQHCIFTENNPARLHIAGELKYKNKSFGVLTTTFRHPKVDAGQLRQLFSEIVDDIAYALHNIEIERLQKITQKALAESEYKYRILSENALTGVYLISNERLEYVNPRFAQIFAYDSPQEVLDLDNCFNLIALEHRNFFKREMEELLSGKKNTLHFEFKGLNKHGNPLDVEIYGTRILYRNKPAVIGTLLDISQKKRDLETIRKLTTAIAQSPTAILITDKNGYVEYVNPTFREITGMEKEEIIGQHFRACFSDDTPEELLGNLWKTINKGLIWKDELLNQRADKSQFWAKLIVTPIMNEQREITNFLIIKEDITERKRLERQLLQTQKMEAIGRLAGGIAHDFNNLLTVINGYAQLVLYQMDNDHPLRNKIEQIYQAGEKAKNLTSQLLAFSRKQMRQPEVINLNSVIKNAEPMLKSLIGEDIVVKMELAPDLWIIESDKNQLEQILLNLSVNARQAMPEGGTLTIRTGNVNIDEAFQKEHEGAETGYYVCLTISDTGVGIEKSILKHIFEPFFTTKPVGEGTGLGLSTVYGIVKQNNGFIYVDSEPGKGATFSIYFPALDADVEITPKEEKEEETDLFSDARILLVEDDIDVRKLTARSLSYFGYRVTLAQNGKEALKLLKANERFDLIITDLVMPEMGGKRLADIIKEKYPHMNILFISGYSEDRVTENGIFFLQKPFSPIELAKTVKEILNHYDPISQDN